MTLTVRLVSLCVLAALIFLGGQVYRQQAQWTIEQKARASATSWLRYFEATIPDPAALLSSGRPTGAQRAALARAKESLGVFRFKLFDGEGRLTFVSDSLADATLAPTDLLAYNPEAAAVIQRGMLYLSIESGTGQPDRPDAYAEVYMPAVFDGVPRGAVEIYVDISDALRVTQAAFLRFAGILGLLTVAGLGVPTVHWYGAWRRLKRSNRDLADAKEALQASAEADRDVAERQQRMAEEVALLGDLNEWLQSSRSQAELFEMVVAFLTRLLPDFEGAIYVYSNSRDVLDGMASWNGGGTLDHMPPEDCWGLRRGRTYEFGATGIAFPCKHVGHEDGRRYLCIPLLAHGETVGLLHLRQTEAAARARGPMADHRRLAQLCAEQISMAIANVRMRDELQDQSVRDALTGLFNRRHMTETLRRLLARAKRTEGTLALLSLDVDHFKKFNDTYGHDAGDMVLRAVGSVLDRLVQGQEAACRPGGEEFVMILPDLDVSDALVRAEEVREQIQAIALRYGEKTLPGVTVSIGVAVSPWDGEMPQDLLRAADGALYAAKARGRNQTMLTSLIDAPLSDAPETRMAAAE